MTAEQALFEKVRKKHSTSETTLRDDIDRRAREQYLNTHDTIPTLEEIDEVINEYRKGKAHESKRVIGC